MTGSGAAAVEPTRVYVPPAMAQKVVPGAYPATFVLTGVEAFADMGAPFTGPACCPATGEMTPALSVHHKAAGEVSGAARVMVAVAEGW